MKRKIDFVGRCYKGSRTHTTSIKLGKFKTTKLRQSMVKTDLGYVDVTVSLDRWGRLGAVLVERSREDFV